MRLANETEATQFVQDASRSYQPMADYIGRTVGVNRCMFTGRHWISTDMLYRHDTMGRHLVNLNPDTNKLRVVLNRIPRFIHETAAATFPDMMEFDIMPPDRDAGPEAAMRAQVLDALMVTAVQNTGLVECAREANYRRCIDGMYGIGLTVKREARTVGQNVESDCILKAFTFDPHRLILDSFNQSLDLWNHEYVIYRDVWTATKIEREYGIKLDPDDLMTVGQLMPMEMALNKLSQNRLYTYLREYSETKGAVVYQVHVKDETGVFPTMLIGVDAGKKETQWLNFDDQETPYGGNGMPLMLLHGYREPDLMVSQSDVALLKEDQDQINLLRTMFARIHQKHAGFQWLIAEDSLAGDGPDDAKSQLNNYVGGTIFYKGGTRDNPKPPPQLVQYPAPHPYLQDVISLHQERDMPAQIHRSPITAGATKSHVPDSTFQSALQAAGQVLGNRQREDTARYEALGRVILGTYVKLAKRGSPSALVQLRRAGFDATDFAMLESVDERYPACEMYLTERSIRFRSTEQKEQSLNEAAQLQMISPEEYRLARASLDTAVTEDDRFYASQAEKWAMKVLLGAEWLPRPLGKATSFFVNAFQKATLDRRAEQDPAALLRLTLAVESMLAYANQEAMMAAAAQAGPQTPPSAGQPAAEQQEMPQEVNIADLITQLNSGMQSQDAA